MPSFSLGLRMIKARLVNIHDDLSFEKEGDKTFGKNLTGENILWGVHIWLELRALSPRIK